jgi:hypothetical protein
MEKPVQQPAKDEPEQQETPTGHTIPVPSRDQVLGFFKKAAKPKKG